MPDTTNRDSLVKNINDRYATQRAGGAFDVKETLGQPNTEVSPGKVIDAKSVSGQTYQTKNGFVAKSETGISQLKVVQSNGSDGSSQYSPPKGADVSGQVIDAASANGQAFQTPNGYVVKVQPMVSQLKVVQSNGQGTDGQSRYVKGIDTRKYSNFK
jgi:hypothetical protein